MIDILIEFEMAQECFNLQMYLGIFHTSEICVFR